MTSKLDVHKIAEMQTYFMQYVFRSCLLLWLQLAIILIKMKNVKKKKKSTSRPNNVLLTFYMIILILALIL